MSDLVLDSYRSLYEDLRSKGVGEIAALEQASHRCPHPLNHWEDRRIVEIRNDLLFEYGPENCFREAYRKFQAQLPYVDEVYVMIGAPGSGKSHLARKLLKPNRIIFDSCAYSPGPRKALLNMTLSYGMPVHGIFLNADLELCFARNKKRPLHMQASSSSIYKAFTYLLGLPPTKSEGFETVTTIPS